VSKNIAVSGLKFSLSPEKLSAGDPIVLMPSLSASLDNKGIMCGVITVIYPSINDPSHTPMPGTFNIKGSGDKVLVGGNPVVLPGDSDTIAIAFPGGPNGHVDVVSVTCEVTDPAQEDGVYL
jgi:hypothetical protein